MHFNYAFSRWSSGNRRLARVQERSSEVTGSNHALGVIFNLAWGPNNFSPSMIWSWRTRSNSRTGLGAELLLLAKSAFCFCKGSKKDRVRFKNATESLEQDSGSQMLCSYEWIIQSYFLSCQQLFSNPQQALLKLSRNNIVFYTRPE